MRKWQAKQNWIKRMNWLKEQRLVENKMIGGDDDDVDFQNLGQVYDTKDMRQDKSDADGEDSECMELRKLALESMERNRTRSKERKDNTTTDVTMEDVSVSTRYSGDQDTLSLFSETASLLL